MAQAYYVDNSIGSDSADGLAPTVGGGHGPWLTTTHVNAGTYNGGDSVLFNSAQTFSGNISLGTGNWGSSPAPSSSAPVTFGSYGGGRATISVSSTSIDGFVTLNIGGIIGRDLIVVGPGTTSGTTARGVNIQNLLSSNTNLDFVQLINLDVSGFSDCGVCVIGFDNTFTPTWSNVTLQNLISHNNCLGNSPSDDSGILVYECNTFLVDRCISHDNPGSATPTTHWTGSGFEAYGSSNGTIQFCEFYNNGAATVNTSGGGPSGHIVFQCTNVVTQFCESHHNHTSGTNDGDGFNVNGSGNTIQYCYSHDNDGIGYLFDTSISSANTTTMRYCVSQNNNVKNTLTNTAEVCLSCYNGSATVSLAMFNNTIYANNGPIIVTAGMQNTLVGHINNNIFYSVGQNFIQQGSFSPTGSLSGLDFNGNDYFLASGAFDINWAGTTYTTFATWKSGATQETVNGGFTSNPLLVNAGGGGTIGGYASPQPTAYDLTVGSPMVGVGLNLNSLFSIAPGTSDFYGNAIPHGSGTGYNVGAFGAVPVMFNYVLFDIVY